MAQRDKRAGAVSVRASSLGRMCAGYGALVASLPDGATDTDATRSGTERHAEMAGEIPLYLAHGSPVDALSAVYGVCVELGLPTMCSARKKEVRVERQLSAVIGRGMLTGSPDVYWHADRRIDKRRTRAAVVVDWKFGAAQHLPHIDHDLQMAAYALLVMRATHADEVAVLRVRVDCGDVDVLDLRDPMVRVSSFERVAEAVSWHVQHYPGLHPGSHCARCLARDYCPTQRAVATAPTDLSVPVGHSIAALDANVLSPADRARALASVAAALAPARSLIDRAERLLRDHVKAHGPIALDDGRSWGMSVRVRDTIADHPQLLAELASEATPDAAWAAAATTKASVLRALQDSGHTRQQALAWWQRQKAAGLVTDKATNVYGANDE